MKKKIISGSILLFMLVLLNACKEKVSNVTSTETQETNDYSGIAISYDLDSENSIIMWKGSKPLKTHNGTIELASGSVVLTDGKIEAGKFSIDMNSITNLDLEGESKNRLENHLKGTVAGKEGDFFNVNEYPFANFLLTEISEKNGKTIITGSLTIKDRTNTIEFPANISIEEYNISIESESFTIDRTLWGVNFQSKSVFDNLGDKFIDDNIELTIDVLLRKA